MASTRLHDRTIAFADGVTGISVDIPTASPINFHQVLSSPGAMARTVIDGKLFLPSGHGATRLPAVIIVPGSLGIAPSHLRHAETLMGLGAAVLVIDPFGARGVTSTVANQAQYSFAASAYDVLAAAQALAGRPEIDLARIGAQGHSRGGSAVLSAAMRRFAGAVQAPELLAVFAAYPWCGQQFLDPNVGRTIVRAVIGDRDGWCSPQQMQGQIQAIRSRGGAASWRIVAGAAHSFDRDTPVETIADAAVTPGAPTAYVADDGAFVHPASGDADPGLTDRDLMVYGLKAGYGIKGAAIGSRAGEAALFRDDMISFWRRVLWDDAGAASVLRTAGKRP